MVRALVVDDETIIAEDLAYQLNERRGWQAEFCSDPTAVLDLLDHHTFDVCFLDIEMPYQSGISLARDVRNAYPEMIIIFATAYAEHAATAYRLPATDYLVKPVNKDVLSEACERVEVQTVLNTGTNEAADDDPAASSIAVKSVGRTDYIKINDIIMGQAAGNYVRLHCRDKEYLHRCSFSELTEQLSPKGFLRCHRSFFVNASKVVSFVRNMNDGDELVLEGNHRAPVSHSHRKSIETILSGT